jgi:hypothetical protein
MSICKRLVLPFVVGWLFLAGCVLGARAEIVCSNFGPSDSFFESNGWTIGYPFDLNQVGQSLAVSCVPKSNVQLASIELVISRPFVTGKNDFVIGIYDNLNNKPNNLLTSLKGIAPEGFPPSAITMLEFQNSIILRKGQRYWIGVHPGLPEPTDLAWFWNPSTAGLQSQMWQSNTPSMVLAGAGWERTLTMIEPVFRVRGREATELTQSLITQVVNLNLQKGVANSLDSKISAALSALDDVSQQNNVAAIGSLGAFINTVEAHRGNQLTAEEANMLIAVARLIIDLLLT